MARRPFTVAALTGLALAGLTSVAAIRPNDASGLAAPATSAAPAAPTERVVLRLAPGASPAALEHALDRRGARLVAWRPGAVPVAVIERPVGARARTVAPTAAAEALPGVVGEEPDAVVTAAGVQSSPDWGLDRIDQRSRRPDQQYRYTATGAGVTVYVIDTGIRATHQELVGRVGPGIGFVPDGRGTSDCYGHGTHVAGIIGGTRFGVAKSARLVPVRVLDCAGNGYVSSVVAGLNWVIANHRPGRPAVANLSLNGPLSRAVNDAVRAAVADGITVVVAAGNEGGDACAWSPGATPVAITVASSDREDGRAGDSNGGRCVDLFAPGVGIRSSWPTSDRATRIVSGTSMAAPHVAGAAALILERAPRLAPAVVAARILDATTAGVISNPGRTPNRLLWVRSDRGDDRPPNDAFATPTPLSPDGTVLASSNAGATGEPDEPAHAGLSATNSVWFRVTFAENGPVVVSTDGSDLDTALAVYTGSTLGALTPVVDGDDRDAEDPIAQVRFEATGGTEYLVAVVGKRGRAGNLEISAGPTANDAFEGARPIDVSTGETVRGTNQSMTAQPGEPAHAGSPAQHSAWWWFVAPADGSVTLRTGGSGFDTRIGVYVGEAVDALSLVAQDDDSGAGNLAAVTFAVTAGVRYAVAVDGFGAMVGAIVLRCGFTPAS